MSLHVRRLICNASFMECQEKETGLQVHVGACVGTAEGVPHPVETNRPSVQHRVHAEL